MNQTIIKYEPTHLPKIIDTKYNTTLTKIIDAEYVEVNNNSDIYRILKQIGKNYSKNSYHENDDKMLIKGANILKKHILGLFKRNDVKSIDELTQIIIKFNGADSVDEAVNALGKIDYDSFCTNYGDLVIEKIKDNNENHMYRLSKGICVHTSAWD